MVAASVVAPAGLRKRQEGDGQRVGRLRNTRAPWTIVMQADGKLAPAPAGSRFAGSSSTLAEGELARSYREAHAKISRQGQQLSELSAENLRLSEEPESLLAEREQVARRVSLLEKLMLGGRA